MGRRREVLSFHPDFESSQVLCHQLCRPEAVDSSTKNIHGDSCMARSSDESISASGLSKSQTSERWAAVGVVPRAIPENWVPCWMDTAEFILPNSISSPYLCLVLM